MEEMHQQKVTQMMKSVEGSAGLLHKPTARRGGAQILKKEEEDDARLLDRCEAKREELKELEEALPRLKECDSEKASRRYRTKTVVGCDGFHPKVSLDLTKETGGQVVEFLEKVEQSGKWPQQACTTMFHLIPKNVTLMGSAGVC